MNLWELNFIWFFGIKQNESIICETSLEFLTDCNGFVVVFDRNGL